MTKDNAAAILPKKAPGTYQYRDEMNFAEFPIAAVSDTVPDNVKTIEFTDEIFDPSTGKDVTRTLTVTAADKFGLPTALDDEVMVGLTQLSAKTEFADRKIYFSRYELIKLLGWRDESKSYKRIEDSLNRWTGVTLQYRKAWWSKEEKCFVNETFHVIDQATVYDRERIARRRKMAKDVPEKALSSFVWNETIFNSFQAGYLKKLDYDFYKSLRTAISKRMFRFLDKRFYHKGLWEFDLREFACEKCGLSKNYSNSELKRKLLPAIRELEEREYLTPLADEDRFARVRLGNWKVTFVKATKRLTVLPRRDNTDDPLLALLTARGITPRSARKLLAHHERSRIEEKVVLFDSLEKRGAIRNRAGWLYCAIVYDYTVVAPARPEGHPEKPTAHSEPQPAHAEVGEGSEVDRDEANAFSAFWPTLTPDEQSTFEAKAVSSAPAFLQKQYHDGEHSKGSLWRVARERILRGHFVQTRVPADTQE